VLETNSINELNGWKILTFTLLEDIEVEKIDILIET